MDIKSISKRAAAAALAAVFCVFTLVGCDNLIDVLDPSDPGPDETIKIGLLRPNRYPSFTQGAELARAQINASGGILGKQVEFIARDNLGTYPFPTIEATLSQAFDLIQNEGVKAIVGPIFSTNSIALGKALTQAGLTTPFVPASTSPVVTQSYTHVALVSAHAPLHSTILSDFARRELKAETAAIIAQKGDAYSQALTDVFTQRFEAAGGTVASADTYPVASTNFSANVEMLVAGGSDICLLTSFPPEVPLIIDQARAAGYEGVFIGGNAWDNLADIYSVLDDNSVLDGSYFTIEFLPSAAPEAQQFAAAYEAAYGMPPPDSFAASGFDATMVLAMAIENAGVDAISLPEGGDAILAGLTEIRDYRGATVISHFDENRLAVKDLVVMKIQDGMSMFHALWENPLKGPDPGGDVSNPSPGDSNGADEPSP